MQQSIPSQAIEILERELKEKTGSLIFSDCGLQKFHPKFSKWIG